MKMSTRIAVSLLMFMVVSHAALAYDEAVVAKFGKEAPAVLGGTSSLASCIGVTSSYTIGDLWFPGVYSIGLTLYSGYYPGSSQEQQIFMSGLWMGGYVEENEAGDPYMAIATFDQLDFYIFDSVCSGFAFARPGQSNLDVESTFDTGYSPHDLGVTVTLRYMMWEDPRYDDFVVIKADLSFSKDLDHYWWGWMTDADIGNNSLRDYYYDDLTGYDVVRGVAYMYDDDGDPAIIGDPSSGLLSPHFVGQVLLSAPPPGGRITEAATPSVSWETFSWWDWNNDVTGQAAAYDRLSAGTIKEFPPDTPFDYRILSGVGPYEAKAGDHATIYIAIVFGQGLDADYWRRTGGGGSPDLGTLVDHVDAAKELFANDLQIDDPAPAAPLLAQPRLSGREVSLEWQSDSEEDGDFQGYRVYKSYVSNTGPWDLIGDFSGRPFVNAMLDTVKIGFPAFYCVTAYDAGENESTKGGYNVKTLNGVVATTLPTDWSGDCEGDCEEYCQGCDECYRRCMDECMRDRRARALDNILVAPNPYRGSADWERADYEGTIMFQNLPERCSIFIYSLTGELISTVYHNLPGDESPDPEDSETGGERWDMLSYNNMSIASGIYIYRVVSDDYGEAIGKFAVIRGER
jgi:hypothetical protein